MAAIDRALGLGLTTADLRSLARELASRPDIAWALSRQPLRPPPAAWPDIGGFLAELEDLPLDRVPAGDELVERVERMMDFLRLLHGESASPGGGREPLLAARLHTVLGRVTRVGQQPNWGDRETIDRARHAIHRAQEELKVTLEALRTEALADLLPFIVRFVVEDAESRGREGELTFDDLILKTRDLLQTQPEAVNSLRRRYDTILIDEFQDTDPLQADIALSFATDPATGVLEPGRLFVVGDPKQSIYRFRRADMAIYASTHKLVREQGSVLPPLQATTRTRPVIIDWVNRVFAELIGDGSAPAVQPPYHAIRSARDASLAGPGVAWFGTLIEGERAPAMRRIEAEQVAAHCLAAILEGWQVQDRDGTIRKARFRDIAILIPTRNSLPALERALESAGVPFRVEGGSLVLQTQDVRDLINCLAAIDDPADEVAIVAALRSPAFACSDVEIATYKSEGGRFDYLRADIETRDGPVAEALRVLARYHAERRRRSLASLVERFVAERGLSEVAVLDRDSRDGFRRMRYVVEQARKFDNAGPESLRAFVSWLERCARGRFRDHEGAGLDDDEDAVRILTIHGAKGLEFPIVVLAGIGSEPKRNLPAFTLDRTTGEMAVVAGSKSNNGRFELGDVDAVHSTERDHARAEQARLLYVAATRARDHLLVSLYRTQRAKESGAERLFAAGAADGVEQRPELTPITAPPAAPFAGLQVDAPRQSSIAEFDETRAELVKQAARQRYTSATALGRDRQGEAEAGDGDEAEPWARGRGGTHLGRAVHAAIQSVPLDADAAAIEAFARAQAVAEAIPHRAGDVARLVRRALESDAAQRARSARRALREVPFAMAEGDTVVEGFVDMVIETPDGLEIVDWKTDDIPKARVPDRMREYELQAGLYVLGLEAATGRPVARVTYVFVSAGVEASPGEPGQLASAAREALQNDTAA